MIPKRDPRCHISHFSVVDGSEKGRILASVIVLLAGQASKFRVFDTRLLFFFSWKRELSIRASVESQVRH